VHQILKAAQGILLVFVLFQIAAIVVALLVCAWPEGSHALWVVAKDDAAAGQGLGSSSAEAGTSQGLSAAAYRSGRLDAARLGHTLTHSSMQSGEAQNLPDGKPSARSAPVLTALPFQMRFFVEPDGGDPNTNFDELAMADRAVSMQHLRTDVEGGRGSTTNNSKYNKVRMPIAQGLVAGMRQGIAA
jgi:hypothetical protein